MTGKKSTYFSFEMIGANRTLFLSNSAGCLGIKISLLISKHSANLQVSTWRQVQSGVGKRGEVPLLYIILCPSGKWQQV